MKTNYIRKNKNQVYFLFLLFFTLYCLKTALFSLDITEELFYILKLPLNIILFIFSCFSFFFIKKVKFKILFVIFIVFFIFNAFVLSNDFYFGFLFLISLIIYSQMIEFKLLLKIIIISHLFTLCLVLPLSYFSESYFYLDDRFGYRFTAGFANPNAVAQYLLSMLCLLLLFLDISSKDNKTRFLLSFILFIFLTTLIIQTQSRTSLTLSFLIYFLFLISLFLTKKNKPFKKTKLIIILLSILIMAFQFLALFLYGKYPITITLNELLSGRIWYAFNIFNSIGWPDIFTGHSIVNFLPLDFFYVQNIYGLGILPFLTLYYLTLKRLIISNYSFFMLTIIFLMTLETFTETYFTVPFYSISLFIIYHKTISN